jgi:hypothetical protein
MVAAAGFEPATSGSETRFAAFPQKLCLASTSQKRIYVSEA